MSLDDLVSLFTSHPGLDSSHQHPRGGQEGQVLAELSLHHGRLGTQLVQHGEEGLEQAARLLGPLVTTQPLGDPWWKILEEAQAKGAASA